MKKDVKAIVTLKEHSPPCRLQIKGRTESDKYKQWDGHVEENYLPELLAWCQHEDIHLFCTESDSWVRWGRGRGGVREPETGEQFEVIAGFEQGAASETWREAGETQHLKVLNL